MEQDILKNLGERVRALRKEKGLTQKELAHSIGKDYQSIQRLELGKVNPSFLYLLEVANGLDIDIKDLITTGF